MLTRFGTRLLSEWHLSQNRRFLPFLISVRFFASYEFHVNDSVLTDLVAESIAQGSELNH